MINVWYYNICDQANEIEARASELPVGWKEDTGRYKFAKDRLLFVASRLLLLRALKVTGYHHDILTNWTINKYRKPCIKFWMPFNISHSGDIAILSFSHCEAIGIDIEKVDCGLNLNDFPGMYKGNGVYPNLELFYRAWVRREALGKAIGTGISDSLLNTDVSADCIEYNGKNYNLKDVPINSNYRCSIAYAGHNKNNLSQVILQKIVY